MYVVELVRSDRGPNCRAPVLEDRSVVTVVAECRFGDEGARHKETGGQDSRCLGSTQAQEQQNAGDERLRGSKTKV